MIATRDLTKFPDRNDTNIHTRIFAFFFLFFLFSFLFSRNEFLREIIRLRNALQRT